MFVLDGLRRWRWRPSLVLWATGAMFSIFSATTNAQGPIELEPLVKRLAEAELRRRLAGSTEEALVQVLTQAALSRDPMVDTVAIYDIIVHYDPKRYHNPRVGTYPLNFEDQFVLWGKRIAHFTRSSAWSSGRFYLRDISSGRIAWVFTADARHLYSPEKLPRKSQNISPYTGLHATSQWLRLMREEDREMVMRRLREEASKRANSLTKDLKP
jgi:hypothetical protein